MSTTASVKATRLPLRGSLLNAAAVVVGSVIGLLAGSILPGYLRDTIFDALGLLTIGLGLKTFLESRNVLLVGASLLLGVLAGGLLGLHNGVVWLGNYAEHLSGQGNLTQGFVAAAVLYCFGPMTVLGCIEESVEGKIQIVGLKSVMDGISSIFLSTIYGYGVLLAAPFVLVFQLVLVSMGRPLSIMRENDAMMAEFKGVGGLMLVGIGVSMTTGESIRLADFLPALIIAPLMARKFGPKEIVP